MINLLNESDHLICDFVWFSESMKVILTARSSDFEWKRKT